MKKLILSVLVILFCLYNGYGQLKISLNVYRDSLLNTRLSNVKIKLITDGCIKKYKIKSLEKLDIIIENPKSNYSIEIKKKGYISLVVTDIKVNNGLNYQLDVILRKELPVDDEKYEGPSELVSFKNINTKLD